MALLRFDGLSFAYPYASRRTLQDVSFEMAEGEYLVLCGPSGCGKTTLLKQAKRELRPAGSRAGKVLYQNTPVDMLDAEMAFTEIGYVQQNPEDQIVTTIVEDDVAFGPENLGIEPAEIRRRVDAALKAVNMYEYRDHAPHKLSGGQKQRVAIAGVIAMETMCIVLDEPTAMLDPRGRQEVMDTIRYLNREKGITVILITHYMDEAVQADRVVVMDGGNILTDGDPRTVFAQVELLKRHKLDVPQATELIYRLNAAGCSISGTPLDEDECVKAIAEYLKLG